MAALDEAVYEFAGAGLIACAAALGLEVPRGAIAHGDAFIGYLTQRGDWVAVARLATLLRQDISSEASARAWPEAKAARTCHVLAEQLELCGPEPKALLDASAGKSRKGSKTLADQTVARMQSAGALAAAGLDAKASARILELLYGRLIELWGVIRTLEPVYRQYFNEVFPLPVASETATEPSATTDETHAGPEPVDEAAVARLTELGIAPERARALVQAGDGEQVQQLVAGGLRPKALARLSAVLDQRDAETAGYVSKIDEMARLIASLREALTRPSNEDADVRRQKAVAAEALADGDLELAARLLKGARKQIRDGRRRIEERLREDLANLDAQMAAEANATAHMAEMRFAARDYPLAAELFAEAFDGLPRGDRPGRLHYTMRQAAALTRQGEELADGAALEDAIKTYRGALELTPRKDAPANWAAAQCGLARALQISGLREQGTKRLLLAVEAYRAALTEMGAAPAADQRAEAECHLAHTLASIGERTGKIMWHREAADAFRRALQDASREAAPDLWTDARLGLGQSLLAIDEQAPDKDALAQAVEVLSAALTGLDARRQRRQWGRAQMNLGSALLAQSEHTRETAGIERAIACLRSAALFGFDRETDGEQWASARMSLANALAACADRSGELSHLEGAAAAYREALQRFDKVSAPIPRAIAELNLGTVLVRLGEKKRNAAHWQEARVAMAAALAAFESEGSQAHATIARKNLDSLQKALAAPVAARA